MPKSIFAYPGGKTYLAQWIIDHFPEHECYVEVFCGGASVLVNKPRSKNEVINDRDGDITQFFDVLRDDCDALVEWLRTVDYSKTRHERWADAFYSGERPDDDIERAGRFFFLRYSQFASKYRTKSGFSSSTDRNAAQKFVNGCGELEAFANRLRGVQIENRDFEVIIERFDSSDTLFYCDPPYVGKDELYSHDGAFDHRRFCDALLSVEGKWIVSYMEIPDEFPDCHVIERDTAQYMNSAHDERETRRTERLLLNFDPEQTPSFAGAAQTTLTDGGFDE